MTSNVKSKLVPCSPAFDKAKRASLTRVQRPAQVEHRQQSPPAAQKANHNQTQNRPQAVLAAFAKRGTGEAPGEDQGGSDFDVPEYQPA